MAAQARVVIIGGGFGGVRTARHLEKLAGNSTEIVLINPENYMLYTPLLPEVAAGVLQPRHIGVPLRKILRRTRVLPGEVTHVDVDGRIVTFQPPEGQERQVSWDRLVLAPGSISRTFPIPGLVEHGYGFKNLAEAVFIRNHVIGQLELADAAEDVAERRCRCTFMVVGAGYAGTELIAESRRAARMLPTRRYGAGGWDGGLVVAVSDPVAAAVAPGAASTAGAAASVVYSCQALVQVRSGRSRRGAQWC